MKLRALCLFALSIAAAHADPAFDVIHYDVRLKPDFATSTIAGEERIRFKSLADGLAAIDFSANDLSVTASMNDALVPDTITDGRRIFRFAKPMKKGETRELIVTFHGQGKRGLTFKDGAVYTNYFTCDAMVCEQDRPHDKATVAIALDLPPNSDAVAPGRLHSKTKTTIGELWRFEEMRPTSAFLYGFAAGALRRVKLDGTKPDLFVLTQDADDDKTKRLFADTRRMLEFFEEKSDVPFAEPAYTQLLIDGGDAQESAAHSTIGHDNIDPILEDPHEDWVIAHELAHQWWGNAITCADWQEAWLNEGITVFMVAAYKEQRWGKADYLREIDLAQKRWTRAKDEGYDKPLSWKGKYPTLRLMRAIAYAKSVIFLDTLRREVGDETFWSAMRLYSQANWGAVVDANALKVAFERRTKRDLTPLFDEWVFGPTPAAATP